MPAPLVAQVASVSSCTMLCLVNLFAARTSLDFSSTRSYTVRRVYRAPTIRGSCPYSNLLSGTDVARYTDYSDKLTRMFQINRLLHRLHFLAYSLNSDAYGRPWGPLCGLLSKGSYNRRSSWISPHVAILILIR